MFLRKYIIINGHNAYIITNYKEITESDDDEPDNNNNNNRNVANDDETDEEEEKRQDEEEKRQDEERGIKILKEFEESRDILNKDKWEEIFKIDEKNRKLKIQEENNKK